MRASYVYFIRQGSDAPIKIGHSYDPVQRKDMLQVGNPDQLFLIDAIRCLNKECACRLEGILNDAYSEDNIRGEWFGGSININKYNYIIALSLELDNKDYGDFPDWLEGWDGKC